jgi:hypothetical protein
MCEGGTRIIDQHMAGTYKRPTRRHQTHGPLVDPVNIESKEFLAVFR